MIYEVLLCNVAVWRSTVSVVREKFLYGYTWSFQISKRAQNYTVLDFQVMESVYHYCI